MSTEGLSFESWLERARLRRERLDAHRISVLEAAFRFLEHGGHDYASRRLVEHFLLHADLGLKVAQVRAFGRPRSLHLVTASAVLVLPGRAGHPQSSSRQVSR